MGKEWGKLNVVFDESDVFANWQKGRIFVQYDLRVSDIVNHTISLSIRPVCVFVPVCVCIGL